MSPACRGQMKWSGSVGTVHRVSSQKMEVESPPILSCGRWGTLGKPLHFFDLSLSFFSISVGGNTSSGAVLTIKWKYMGEGFLHSVKKYANTGYHSNEILLVVQQINALGWRLRQTLWCTPYSILYQIMLESPSASILKVHLPLLAYLNENSFGWQHAWSKTAVTKQTRNQQRIRPWHGWDCKAPAVIPAWEGSRLMVLMLQCVTLWARSCSPSHGRKHTAQLST